MVPLHDYQKYMRNFIFHTPFAILMVGMGAGKTLATLDMLYYLNPNKHVLIIAPKNIARLTWDEEIKKWGYPFPTCSLLVRKKKKGIGETDLTPKERENIYKSIPDTSPTVYFINREKTEELTRRFPEDKWPFGIVIIDESQGFKSYKSERFKCLKKVRPYMDRVIELTGTPNPNGLEDLWPQIYLLDQGKRLGKNITAFRNAFFTPGRCRSGYPYEWIPKLGAKEQIFARIHDIAISIEGVTHDRTIQTHTAVLSNEERKIYNELKKEHILEIEGEVVDAQNAAILSGKLCQLAAGSLYKPVPEGQKAPPKREYWTFHDHKLVMCKEIIEQTKSPTLIAYSFQSDKERLMDAFGGMAEVFDGSSRMMDAWNNGKIPILLIHPASAGHGLNFQFGGHTLIWYTRLWNLEHYLQTNARIARQGQTQPVVIHELIIKNTIDERISEALNRKDMCMEELIEAVRAEIPIDGIRKAA